MQNNALIIEKLVVDVFTESHPKPNALLQDINVELKDYVLPLVEKKLNEQGIFAPHKSVWIDSITLDIRNSSVENWKQGLSEQIAEQIANAYHEHKEQIDAVELPLENQLFNQMVHFLQFGVLSNSDFGENFTDLQVKWIKCGEKGELFTDLGDFLLEHEKMLSRFIQQIDVRFLNRFLLEYYDPIFAGFLSKIVFNSRKNLIIGQLLIENALKLNYNDSNSYFDLLSKRKNKVFYDYNEFLDEIDQKWTKFDQNYVELSQKLIKVLRPEKDNLGLTGFISFLKQDLGLNEIIAPLLIENQQKFTRIDSINQWVHEFVKSLGSLGQINETLAKLKSVRDRIQEMDPFHSPINLFISELNKKLKVVDNESRLSKIPDKLFINNAGIILLNPFLPTLFKNLEFLDEKGKWQSEKHQVEAIYLMNYLATGIYETSEDQLYLAKILVGYSLDEVLPNFDSIKNNWSLKNMEPSGKLEVELVNLLSALRENWRPMKNCTWAGLRNDFLSRSGELSQMESMQYVLTVESHALDILLPHKKWGMSMIKYSWMGEILNVEWG